MMRKQNETTKRQVQSNTKLLSIDPSLDQTKKDTIYEFIRRISDEDWTSWAWE